MNLRRILAAAVLGLAALGSAVQAQNALPAGFERVELTMDGGVRLALVYAPTEAKSKATPVVFAFHGKGGTAAGATREFAMQREWPDAITVCMQALNTPGRFMDFEGKQSGWQLRKGDHGDRDLKFFDTMLARLKQDYKIDDKRVYALGMSSGGYFTYLLWAQRGDLLAAVAPAASEAADNLPALKPKPALLLAGKTDERVKYEWARATMDAVRKLNGCAADGAPWGENCTLFSSGRGMPVVEFVHPGGHVYPKGAAAASARFFKEQPGRDKADPARWEKEIAAFEKRDQQKAPAKNGILFVGSSSIRLWDLAKSFPGLDAINRGFGGSHLADSTRFADRLILKHEPRLVVVYAGDNDLAEGKTPGRVATDFQALATAIHSGLPKTRIAFIAIKPSVKRWNIIEKQRQANALIAAQCEKDERLLFIDVVKPMLGDDGKPRAELFADDGLHLSAKGYELWASLVKPHLK